MDTIKTSQLRLRIGLSVIPSKDKLLNADACYEWIFNRDHLIGWTYNFNASCPLWRRFDKLISCQGRPSQSIRIANNTHMKCYLSLTSMLITSFNLTYPTVNDMGIETSNIIYVNYMRRMFNKHWKELE